MFCSASIFCNSSIKSTTSILYMCSNWRKQRLLKISLLPQKMQVSSACISCVCYRHRKLMSFPEKYILRRYTKCAVTDPSFNRRDLRSVMADDASQYCTESVMLQLNMRVHRKSLRSAEQTTRAKHVMQNLEHELDVMHSVTS